MSDGRRRCAAKYFESVTKVREIKTKVRPARFTWMKGVVFAATTVKNSAKKECGVFLESNVLRFWIAVKEANDPLEAF